MNIVFLDVDGVLNSIEYLTQMYKKLKRTLKQEEMLDPICINNLKEIVDKTNARIVITSSWKICDLDILIKVFSKYNLQVYDATINYGDKRGKEIREWLDNNKDVNNYIIIDDDFFKDYVGLEDKIIQTSMYKGRGLNNSHVEMAIKKLKRL